MPSCLLCCKQFYSTYLSRWLWYQCTRDIWGVDCIPKLLICCTLTFYQNVVKPSKPLSITKHQLQLSPISDFFSLYWEYDMWLSLSLSKKLLGVTVTYVWWFLHTMLDQVMSLPPCIIVSAVFSLVLESISLLLLWIDLQSG